MPEMGNAFNGKTVLVTGGAGMIGTTLVRRLVTTDVKKVVVLDNLSSSYIWNVPKDPKVKLIQGDILEEAKLEQAFRSRPQIVYHLAAHFANQNSVEYPELDLMVNGMGILRVLEHSRLAEVERFVYASSGCGIYGNDVPMPFTEEYVSMDLHTPYQVTKMLGELYTSYFHNLHRLPIVNARFFNVYGPGEVPGRYRNVIPNFFYWAMNGQPLPITGTGDETRDFTYTEDIVYGLMASAYYDEAVGEAINLATGKEIRILDLANMINDVTGNDAGIVFKERRNWDAKTRLLASIEKARKILKYEPKMEFKEGLHHIHDWFKKNWNNIQKSAEF